MKTWLILGTAVVAALAVQATANAQTPASAYRYCLEQRTGSTYSGTLCRYHTLAQCWASKTTPADFCYPNPGYKGK
jgi:hypothetical protein